MKGRPAADPLPGPMRWSYRSYSVLEKGTAFGRRFEVRSPKDELVLFCRFKKSEPRITFWSDEQESRELFRLEPTKVRLYQRAWEAFDPLTQRPFGQVRKKVYEPTEKVEWFIFNPDGEQLGLLTETAPEQTLLRRILPVERLFSKAWALHWGQSIAGAVQPKPTLVGDRLEVDLGFDHKDEIDRRLALATVIAARADAHARAEKEKASKVEGVEKA